MLKNCYEYLSFSDQLVSYFGGSNQSIKLLWMTDRLQKYFDCKGRIFKRRIYLGCVWNRLVMNWAGVDTLARF